MTAHRRHTCTAADENQLLRIGQIVGQEELAVRTRNRHLVAGLAREDVRRTNAGIHLHERTGSTVERRRSNADVQHDDVALGRMVGHRIGTERRFGVGRHQVPHLHPIPVGTERLVDLHIGECDAVVFRNVHLNVTAAAELQVLALGQLHDELFEERRDVTIRDDRTLPLLDAQNGLGNLDFEVLLHLDLTAQTPMVFGHLA